MCSIVDVARKRVAARIRNVIMMKRIWKVPLLPLIIVMLGVSITAVAVIYTSRIAPAPSVVLGTGHLIDGYHVAYGENLSAKWVAQMFCLSRHGDFSLDLRCDYFTENPTLGKIYHSQDNVSVSEVDLEYATSIILLQVGSAYKLEPWGDFTHGEATGIVPVASKFTNSKSCLIQYRGSFSPEVNVTELMTQAYAIEVRLSWIRVFREKNNGTCYYQWLQGNSDVWTGKKLEVDKTYSDLSGGFEVYYPIPESVTSPLLPWEFDYVEWIKENAQTASP